MNQNMLLINRDNSERYVRAWCFKLRVSRAPIRYLQVHQGLSDASGTPRRGCSCRALLTQSNLSLCQPHLIRSPLLTMAIHIYAEHLINIRTLTIQVSLKTPSHAGTKATISADGNTLSVSHESDIASIELPVNIASESDKALSIPATPTNDLSFRLRLDNNTGGSLQNSPSSETIIPWTATSLSNQVELQCKECNAVVVPRGKIQIWKDLPSEGWAEMMEFWHCHKPNEPHDHEHQTDKKGYSADSTLAITPSVGLVNATNFIIADADCQNIKVGLGAFPSLLSSSTHIHGTHGH